MSNVPVPQDRIDAWARFAETVRCRTSQIRSANARGMAQVVEEIANNMHLEAAAALVDMERAGAITPAGLPTPREVPLHLLDTPANRRLARALRDAYEAAVEVDRERGAYTPGEPEDGPAALPIVELLIRVEEECYGPAGRGERG